MRPATCWSWAGGPAGLAAALAPGPQPARAWSWPTSRSAPGGRLLAERHEIAGAPALAWAKTALAELAEMPAVTLLPDTTAFGDDRNAI